MPDFYSSPTDRQAVTLTLRISFAVLILSTAMYVVISEMLAREVHAHPPGLLKTVLAAVSMAVAVAVLYLRFSVIGELLSPVVPGDLPSRLTRLRVTYLVCYALAEAVSLCGLIYRMLGASRMEAAPLFAGALALFLICYPQLPSDLPGQ